MSFLLPAAVVVFLIIIGFYEGWKKALKLVAIFLGVTIISAVVMAALKLDINLIRVVGFIEWGIFLLGLIFYSLINGFVNRF